MRLLKIFEDQYKAMKLIRVRLKSDPANQSKSYEGYVLHENDDGTMDMCIGSDETLAPMIIAIKTTDIDINKSLTNVDKLKDIISKQVDDSTIIELIQNLNTISDIEAMIISNGLTFEDLYKIYKCYFLTTESNLKLKPRIFKNNKNIQNEALQDYVDSNASSFLKGVQKVGGVMSGLKSGAEAAKRLTGEGDWSVLSNLGNKFLARVLDRQTEKISLFGKKGYTSVRIIDETVKQMLLRESNTSRTDTIFEDAASQFLDVIKNDVQTYKKKKKKSIKNVTPAPIQPYKDSDGRVKNTTPNSNQLGDIKDANLQPTTPPSGAGRVDNFNRPDGGNKPPQKGPNQPGDDSQSEQEKLPELNFTITNQKFYGAKGTGYTLQPADEATKQVLTNKNLQYALFVKRQDSDLDVVNNGSLYFYQANNVLDPKYTQQSLNFTYDATIKSYIMGAAVTQKITFNVDNANIMIIDDQDFIIMGRQGNIINFKPKDIKVFNADIMKVLKDDKPKSAKLIFGRDGKPSRLNRNNQYMVDVRTLKQL